MSTEKLINMMFESKPLEMFEELWKTGDPNLEWGRLLHMCYCEASYESIGGDFGDMDDPSINHWRLDYLEKLILFLEEKGLKAEH